jgi:hypothetical protein
MFSNPNHHRQDLEEEKKNSISISNQVNSGKEKAHHLSANFKRHRRKNIRIDFKLI